MELGKKSSYLLPLQLVDVATLKSDISIFKSISISYGGSPISLLAYMRMQSASNSHSPNTLIG